MRSRLLERLPPAGRRPEKSKAVLVPVEVCCRIRVERPAARGVSLRASALSLERPGLVDAEGRSAAAGRGGVRVLDREAAARDGVDKVDLGTVQIPDADRVDVELHAVRFVDLIADALPVFLDHQSVLESGTTAALNEHPESAARFVLFGKQLVDLRRGRFRYIDHLRFLLANCPLYH